MSDKKKILRIAGICGMTVPVAAFSCIFLAISMSPWFSWTANALSDLGMGQTAWVFNSGLMAGGILSMVFSAGLFVAVRGRTLARVGAALFFIDALALFGIGLFPSSIANVLQDTLHNIFTVAFFMLFPISISIFGSSDIMVGSKKFGSSIIAIGALSLVPWLFSWDGIAIPEALSALAISVWAVAQGARLYLGRIKS